MRPIRCPFPCQMYEITTRTINGEFLLRPSAETNALILGVIGHAQDKSPLKIHAFTVMSTHYHLLVTCTDAQQLSHFMQSLNGNLSRKLNRLHRRCGPMWHRRFRAIGVAPDEETQTSRLRYLLAHGVKEKLVRRAVEWPGVTSLSWLLAGKKITGIWTSFTARYRANQSQSDVRPTGDFETTYEIKMSVLPCWAALPAAEWRQRVAEMVDEIDQTSELPGRDPVNKDTKKEEKYLKVDPTYRAGGLRRSPAPTVHAVNLKVRDALCTILRAIRHAYVEASIRFRAGEFDVEFPRGTFRPHGDFVFCEDDGAEMIL